MRNVYGNILFTVRWLTSDSLVTPSGQTEKAQNSTFKPTEASLGHIDCTVRLLYKEELPPSLWSTNTNVVVEL